MRARGRPQIAGYLFLGLLMLAWQLTTAEGIFPIRNMPTLGQVVQTVVGQHTTLAFQLLLTVRRACLGLLAAVIVAIPVGIAIARIQVLADLLEPVIEILRPLPTPAIIPLVMLIAGIGDQAKIMVVFYAALFPILLNTIDGVRGIDPMLPMTAASLRLRRHEAFFLVYLPAGLPQIMAGIRISVAVSFLVAITAEMLLSTDGMGVYLLASQQRFQLANGIAGIILVAVAAWGINRIYLVAERRLLHWHAANTKEKQQSG